MSNWAQINGSVVYELYFLKCDGYFFDINELIKNVIEDFNLNPSLDYYINVNNSFIMSNEEYYGDLFVIVHSKDKSSIEFELLPRMKLRDVAEYRQIKPIVHVIEFFNEYITKYYTKNDMNMNFQVRLIKNNGVSVQIT